MDGADHEVTDHTAYQCDRYSQRTVRPYIRHVEIFDSMAGLARGGLGIGEGADRWV